MRFRIDFHVHTENSPDALGSLKEISYYARKRKLDAVVVADHNRFTLDDIQEVEDVTFFPAIELRTFAGHVVCLSPKRHFDPRVAYHDPVECVHDAGGYAIWAHPFDFSFMRSHRNLIAPDAVEVYNSTSFPFYSSSKKAFLFAESMGLPMVAGSDAHMPKDVGLCYVEIEANSLYEAIFEIFKGKGEPNGQATSLSDFIQLNVLRILRKMF